MTRRNSAALEAADYSLTPAQLGTVLQPLVASRQPTMIWGPPGVGKSEVSQQVAATLGYNYLDVRALLLDPVDLRGIPWRDAQDRTRWAPPSFLPPTDSQEQYLINLEELPAATPMVQTALYQLVLDRKCGEYELPPGAAVIACGNRESDRAGTHRMATPLASRFVHIEVCVDAAEWAAWAARQGLAAEVIFFIQMRPELLHQFDPQGAEPAFPCPRTWEFVSRLLQGAQGLSFEVQRALYRGTVGTGAAIEFCAFLRVWQDLPHPRVVLSNPAAAIVPDNASALLALCGSLYRLVDDTTMDSLVTYARRLRPEVGEFLINACVRRDPTLQQTRAFITWAALGN